MNQGKFLQSINETTRLRKTQITFQPQAIEAYYRDLFAGQMGLNTIASTRYLLPVVFCDYVAKTLLSDEGALFLNCDIAALGSGVWLGGHNYNVLTGDFVLSNPRVVDQKFLTVKSEADTAGADKINAVFAGLNTPFEIFHERCGHHLKRNPNLRIFGQISGGNSAGFIRDMQAIVPQAQIKFWSKVQTPMKRAAGPAERRHFFYLGTE